MNKVRCFVVVVAFVAVWCDIPVLTSRAVASVCDSRRDAFAILLVRLKYVAIRLHHSRVAHSPIFVVVAVYYSETVKLRGNLTVLNLHNVKL